MVSTAIETPVRADPFRTAIMILATIAFLYFTGEVLKPLALAVLLSFALAPAARLLERCGLPRVVAVVCTVLISLGFLGGIGYVVGQQLTSLAQRLPDYQENIESRINKVVNPARQSMAGRLKHLADELTAKMEKQPAPGSSPKDTASSPHEHANQGVAAGSASSGRPERVPWAEAPLQKALEAPIPKVEVIARPSFQEQLRVALGPYLEFLGVASFVLILVLFILMGREELNDRVVGLFGHRRVSLTTRTMQEIGQRISRYLGTFTLVNSCFGIVVGSGLWLIGIPYAVLWGCLAAMLRFIPYVGPAVAFVLPLVFSIAHFPGWTPPLEVVALFAVLEILLCSFLEPVIYGKTTGISALALLVAAMFWTWLWGTLGLLLSTPLTVCLAVLGKHVPSLWFFAALLKDGTELEPDVRFYQRLVALDREGAIEVVAAQLKQRPRVEVFDRVLVPALSRAEHDAARDELDEPKQAFVWGVVGEILDNLEDTPDFSLDALAVPSAPDEPESDAAPVPILGLVAEDTSDALVLRMLGQLLAGSGYTVETLRDTDSSLQVVEQVAEHSPSLVVVSHLPPEGATLARYLVRRLRAQFADLPIIVGRWGQTQTDGSAKIAEGLLRQGASRVVVSLAEARTRILGLSAPEQNKMNMSAPAALPA
jgi:predicted PurR-regulated permease PerM